eukprot:Nk52_evm1s392 gene=Nk52_evmTU1s392
MKNTFLGVVCALGLLVSLLCVNAQPLNEQASGAQNGANILIGVDDDTIDTIRVDYYWPGYDIIGGTLSPNLAFKNTASKYISHSMIESSETFALYSSESSYYRAFSAKASVSGSYAGFSASASTDYSSQYESHGTSVKLQYLARKQTYGKGFPNALTKDALTEDALQLWSSDRSAFYSKYGTHVITAKYYGCYVDLDGAYTFASEEEKEAFSASLEMKYSGVASASASGEIAKTAKSFSKQAAFTATLNSNVDLGTPTDRSDLNSWMKLIDDSFPAKCTDGKGSLNKIRLISFASFLDDGSHYDLTVSDFIAITEAEAKLSLADKMLSKALNYYSTFGIIDESSPDLATWVPKNSILDVCGQSVPYAVLGGTHYHNTVSLKGDIYNHRWARKDYSTLSYATLEQYWSDSRKYLQKTVSLLASAVTEVTVSAYWRIGLDGDNHSIFGPQQDIVFQIAGSPQTTNVPDGMCCNYKVNKSTRGSCDAIVGNSCTPTRDNIAFIPSTKPNSHGQSNIIDVHSYDNDNSYYPNLFTLGKEIFVSAGRITDKSCTGLDDAQWCDGMWYIIKPNPNQDIIVGCTELTQGH